MAVKDKQEARFDPTSFDASQRRKQLIPSFVHIPTGAFEVDEDDKLVYDDSGDPVEKTKPFLVSRSGKALKEIMRREFDLNEQARQEIREEKADDDGNSEAFTDDELADRRRNRNERAVDFTYWVISNLLLDPETRKPDGTMQHPPAEWVSEHLDYEIAGEWTEVFVPTPEITFGPDGEETAPLTPTDAGSGAAPGAST